MTYSSIKNIPLIILDRDGVINKKAQLVTGEKYILSSENLHIYPDFFDFALWAKSLEKDIVVATNQQGLALNLISPLALDSIHQKIQKELLSCGAKEIKGFYICGHIEGTCSCRKPAPGLLLEILSDYNLSPSDVIFIGDSMSDKLAAETMKIRFIQIMREPCQDAFSSEFINSLSQMIEVIA
jgi:histidinol-phosphate phosphatase family protein